MDVDALLAQLRDSVYRYGIYEDMKGSYANARRLQLSDEIVADIKTLDGWLSNGGFKPNGWN